MWEKFKASFKNSVTIVWARVVALSGLIFGALINVVGDPGVTSAVQSAFQPKYLVYWLLGIGLVTEFARRRTAK